MSERMAKLNLMNCGNQRTITGYAHATSMSHQIPKEELQDGTIEFPTCVGRNRRRKLPGEAAHGLAEARSDQVEARSSKSTVEQSPTPVDYESLQNEAPELEPGQQTVPPEDTEFMNDYQGTKRSGHLAEAIDELEAQYP